MSALAFAGGFSHTNCSRQAFLMLRQPEKNISYRALPPLPWELAETMLVGVGSKLYSIGGSDCGLAPNTERFLTWSDRWGANRGLGKRVLLLDLAACPQLWRKEGEGAQAGGNGAACEWQRLQDFPGTPRSGGTLVAIKDIVYLLGGYASANSTRPRPKTPVPCTSVAQPGCSSNPADSAWKLNTTSMRWTEIASMDHPAADTTGYGVWRDRFIVSVGGIDRGRALTYPGHKFKPTPAASRLSKLNDTCSPTQKGWGSNTYSNSISIFDTRTERFGVVTSTSTSEPGLVIPGCPAGLPLNCYSPAVGIVGDQIFVSGGECDPHHVAATPAQTYWHYPRITLLGTLSAPATAEAP